MKPVYIFAILFLFNPSLQAQNATISGVVLSDSQPVSYANIGFLDINVGTVSDSRGEFKISNLSPGTYVLHVSHIGFDNYETELSLEPESEHRLTIRLKKNITGLEELVITGVAKISKMRENPISIQSISPAQIQQTPETNIVDILAKHTPGLNAVKTGPNISKPFIRGLGYNRVLTLYDGMRQEGQQWGDEHGLEVDSYNIERAEVIKGPASLMYGSDALAGVVSFFPTTPSFTDNKIKGGFTSEYQTNHNLIGNGLNLGYNNGKTIFELRGSYRLAKNYRNPKDGRVYLTNFNETNMSALAGFQTKKGYSHVNFTYFDNNQAIPDGSRDSLTRRFTKQIHENTTDNVYNRPIVASRELNSYRIPDLSQRIRHYRLYLNNFYVAGKGDITVLTGVQQNLRTEYGHPEQPRQPAMDVRLNTFNYGVRYNAPSFLNLETALGFNGMLQSNKNLNATDFPIPDYNLYDGGFYMHVKWNRDRLTLSGGARYDVRALHWQNFYVAKNTLTGFNEQVSQNKPGAVLQFADTKKTFNDLSAGFGLTYRLTDEISVKSNIGRSFRAPNITELASNGLDPGARIIYVGNSAFRPEFSLQEDLGFILRYDDLSADFSFFNNNVNNFIYLNAVTDANGVPLIDNQGNRTFRYTQSKARLYGSEIWLVLHPESLPGLQMNNNFSVIYGFNRAPEFKGKGVQGEYLPLIPPLQVMSSLSYSMPVVNSIWLQQITPKFEVEHAQKQNRFLGLNETESATDGYTLFNAGLTADFMLSAAHTVSIQLQINNLFNTAYQNHLSRLKYFEDHNGGNGIYNMGRNIILKMTLPL